MMWLLLLSTAVAASLVVELTDETFDTKVTADGVWLLDFYAPWCAHCQKIAPILDTLSEEGVIQIGTIDATANPKLKEKFQISSFPTLLFSNAGSAFREYRSGRTLSDFQQFQQRISAEPTQEVKSLQEIEQYLEKNAIVFLLVLTKADTAIFNTYLSVAQYFQHADTFLTASISLGPTFPITGIYKVEKGEPEPIQYDAIQNIQADELTKWIETNRFPIFPQLSGQNFYDMANHGKKLVLACTTLKDPIAHKEMIDAVLALAREWPEYAFGWLDGHEFQSFVSRFLVFPEDLPKVVVLDAPNERFYEREHMTLQEIPAFLLAISDGQELIRYQGFYGWKTKFTRFTKRWFPYSLLLCIPFFIVLYGLRWMYVLATTFDDEDEDDAKRKKKN